MLSLALTNTVRNINKSLLTLLVMALAAMVMTSGLSLSQGIARQAYSGYRAWYGGDIVVFSPGFIGAAPVSHGDVPLVQQVLPDSGFNQLARLYPDFLEGGYLAESHWVHAPLEQVLNELAHYLGVADVRPIKTMPASFFGTAADLKVITSETSEMLFAGRLPAEPVHGVVEVLANAYGGTEMREGDIIIIEVPEYRVDAVGVPYAVYASNHPTREIEARVVGLVRWPTRSIMWGSGGDEIILEQAYLHAPDIYLRESDWDSIWGERSAGATYPAVTASLTVENLSNLNVISSDLRKQYPHLTIMATPAIARHSERYAILDRFYRIPEEGWVPYDAEIKQGYVPVEFGMLSVVLLFLNAGMLMASQMLARVTQRKSEIGTLKAIGARGRDVVTLILLEAVVLALLGASAGFAIVRIAGIHQALTNNLPVWEVVSTTLTEMGQVLGLTTLIALLFGVVPAAKVARLSVMEVFRNA